MKKIPLTQGLHAIVDDDQFDFLSQWKWYAVATVKDWSCRYATRHSGRQSPIYMHRVILAATKGQVVDHINHNGLDNRRCNLRICTRSQNQMNQKKQIGRKYKGVSYLPGRTKGWRARINWKGRGVTLGYYSSATAAALAYDVAARILYREFACTNGV